MVTDIILTALILLPLVGAGFILLFTNEESDTVSIKAWTLLTTLVTFILSLGVWFMFER